MEKNSSQDMRAWPNSDVKITITLSLGEARILDYLTDFGYLHSAEEFLTGKDPFYDPISVIAREAKAKFSSAILSSGNSLAPRDFLKPGEDLVSR